MNASCPVGSFIRARLRKLDHSQSWLAEVMDVSSKHITQVITGKALISADMAVRIERAIGLDAYLLMSVQTRGQVVAAREAVDATKPPPP